jgi:pectate lyase
MGSKVASSRRRMQEAGAAAGGGGCMTGNPIDDCWRCAGTDWRQDRQRLADCGLGFGRNALGGKGGPLYVVTDSSDRDPVNPVPGTLRHAAIQEGPLWIVFAADMTIRLNEELLVNSYKTIDGRGARVHIGAGGACITLQYVSNVIIHNVHVHDCVPAGNANVRSSPTHYGWRTRSDGDGISLFGARDVWVDHCALWRCADGLVDAIMGSTAITVSNSYFAHHDEVMLLGASDAYLPDSAMQVTIAFNRFGPGLVQRMPRCRRGYFHIVNNDYTSWEMYAIGGSASPTINSQGNRYIAPADPNAKEVRELASPAVPCVFLAVLLLAAPAVAALGFAPALLSSVRRLASRARTALLGLPAPACVFQCLFWVAAVSACDGVSPKLVFVCVLRQAFELQKVLTRFRHFLRRI